MFKALLRLLAPIFTPINAVDAAPKPKTTGIIRNSKRAPIPYPASVWTPKFVMKEVITTTEPQVQKALIEAKDPSLTMLIILWKLITLVDTLSFRVLHLNNKKQIKQKAAKPFPITIDRDDPEMPKL